MQSDRPTIELEILVLRCQRGEREAFEELVRNWERSLFFYIRRLLADEEDARQVLQDVWLQVLRGIRSLQEPRRLPVWLYAITRNTVMSHYRAEFARERILDKSPPREPADEDEHVHFDDAELVHFGLSRIPRADRELLTLFFLRDLSIDEVAEVLLVPPGTVKSRLFKAKKTLREVFEREGRCDE